MLGNESFEFDRIEMFRIFLFACQAEIVIFPSNSFCLSALSAGQHRGERRTDAIPPRRETKRNFSAPLPARPEAVGFLQWSGTPTL